MSDTPRTDKMIDSCGDYEKPHAYIKRLHEFAKGLERELTIARPEAMRAEQPGQHLSTDLHEALRIMKELAEIISATPIGTYKDWAMGPDIPLIVRAAEAFIAKPRSIFAPSPQLSGEPK